MELRVLEYFVVTATERSMTNAAKRLHISQPTLSIQLRELEEELDTVLLERTNRGIMLTTDGEYFFTRAKEILSLVSNTVSNLQSNDELAGTLTLGGAETVHNKLLFDIIRTMRDTSPRVSVSFLSANADHILTDLDTGLIEFAIVMGNVDTRKYNSLALPYKDTWILCTQQDSPLASKKEITGQDLVDEPLIISDQDGADSFVAAWIGRTTEELNIVGYYNLVYNASLMAQSGIGSILTIDGLINIEGTDLVSIPLAPQLKVSCHLLWKKNNQLSSVGAHFLELLQQTI